MTNKYFGTPFASNGDTLEIPEITQSDGAVSYQEGYGADYEANPTLPTAKFISRAQMNELFHEVTSNLKTWQEYGYYPYNASITYSMGGRCNYDDGLSGIKAYVSTVNNNLGIAPSVDGTVQPGWQLASAGGGNLPDPTGQAGKALVTDGMDVFYDYINVNLVAMSPTNPTAGGYFNGDVYYNTASGLLYLYDNGVWLAHGSPIKGRTYVFGGVIYIWDGGNLISTRMPIATDAEAEAGTREDVAVNPKQLKEFGGGGGKWNVWDYKITDHELAGDEAVGWLKAGWKTTLADVTANQRIQEAYDNGIPQSDSVYWPEMGETITVQYRKASNGWKIALESQKSAIDTLYQATGSAWYHIIASDGTVYAPKTKNFVRLTAEADDLNEYGQDQIVDITGTFWIDGSRDVTNQPQTSGAYYNAGTSVNGATHNAASGNTGPTIGFSAARVVNTGDQVQPRNNSQLLYFCVGEAIINPGVIDGSGVVAQVTQNTNDIASLKAGVTVVEAWQSADGISSYRIWSDGLIEQRGTVPLSQAGVNATVYLPTSFKTKTYQVVGLRYQDNAGGTLNAGAVRSKDYDYFTANTVQQPMDWLAVGY